MNTERNGSWRGAFLFALPILFIIGVFVGAAHGAAKNGKSYKFVRRILLPLTFIVSNFFGAMVFIFCGWMLSFIFQSTDMANYVIGKTSELTLISYLFGDPRSIPIWHVVIFQVVLWFLLGRAITRHLTLSVYDFALQKVGEARNEHPYYSRQHVLKYDPDFAEADAFYMNRGKPVWLGFILVWWFSATVPEEYYHDYGQQ